MHIFLSLCRTFVKDHSRIENTGVSSGTFRPGLLSRYLILDTDMKHNKTLQEMIAMFHSPKRIRTHCYVRLILGGGLPFASCTMKAHLPNFLQSILSRGWVYRMPNHVSEFS